MDSGKILADVRLLPVGVIDDASRAVPLAETLTAAGIQAIEITLRTDVDMVVTEHGIADIKNKPLRQRAEALIRIAAPEFREELARLRLEDGNKSAERYITPVFRLLFRRHHAIIVVPNRNRVTQRRICIEEIRP